MKTTRSMLSRLFETAGGVMRNSAGVGYREQRQR
jgi:hypothetical protein